MLTNKVKWVLALGLVFLLVLATNLVDRTNFKWMSESVATIYEDRLVAKGFVYDMRSILAEKQIALAAEDPAYLSDQASEDAEKMQALIASFEQTKLTPEEASVFESLIEDSNALEALERKLAGVPDALTADASTKSTLEAAHDAVLDDLSRLARIQLEVGERERVAAMNTMRTIDVVTKIEIGLLILVGLLIALVILFWPSEEGA
jgi:hypothetical protein